MWLDSMWRGRKIVAIHLAFWLTAVASTFILICCGYYIFHQWYIPTDRISVPLYFDYRQPAPRAITELSDLRQGVVYDISVQLLVPDQESLCESLGNFMLEAQLKTFTDEIVNRSLRPTLLPYRSAPVRLAVLALRMVPVVLGLAHEATLHRVFLFEKLRSALPSDSYQLELSIDTPKLPIYRATLEVVAHFSGIRYFMYYWKWTCFVVVLACGMFWSILLTTIFVGLSLYSRLSAPAPAENTTLNGFGPLEGSYLLQASESEDDLGRRLKLRHFRTMPPPEPENEFSVPGSEPSDNE